MARLVNTKTVDNPQEEIPEVSTDLTFTINPTPSDAKVVINGEERLTFNAPSGTEITWSVSKEEYEEQSGIETIEDNVTKDIVLSKINNDSSYTYVKTGLGYVEFDFELDENYVTGSTYEDYIMGKWILLSPEQLTFKDEHPTASIKEVINMKMEERPTPPSETVEGVRNSVLNNLDEFVKSSVLIYKYNELRSWIDKKDRPQVLSNINSLKSAGQDSITLSFTRGEVLTLQVELAKQLMIEMDLHEDKCDKLTSDHKEAINKLQDIDELKSYDYRSNYPSTPSDTTESLTEKVKVRISQSPDAQTSNLAYSIINDVNLPVDLALQMSILYPVWGEENGPAAIGTSVSIGFRCRVVNGEEKLYEVIQPHEINELYKPGTEEGNPYWMRVSLDHEPTLEEAKFKKLGEITAYDTSSDVNSFILNGASVWLDKATRVGLMNSTQIEKAAGHETTTLWLGGISMVINCDQAIQMLSALELYALQCYNKTAEHKSNVTKLESIQSVEEYDYTIGYPEKLNFSTT